MDDEGMTAAIECDSVIADSHHVRYLHQVCDNHNKYLTQYVVYAMRHNSHGCNSHIIRACLALTYLCR